MGQVSIPELFEEASRLILESSTQNAAVIQGIVREIIDCFERGNKLLIFGNGGSASQAQHFAAELVNRFTAYRAALPAIALTTDTSILTSIGNDLDFKEIFSRQIEALGNKGDIAWGLSTSGRSPNIIKAFEIAKPKGMQTVGFTGQPGSRLARLSDMSFTVPSSSTPRIQEVHLCAGHAICELVESHFLEKTKL